MTEYDSPWKDAIDIFFEAFIKMFFEDLHALIDWSYSPRMLDKEFQQIAAQSDTGERTVDKLVEVRMRSGETKWLLVHLEIQNQWVDDFAKRMFVYYYRIRDKYDKQVVSLAILGDMNPRWRPNTFIDEVAGCRVEFRYPLVKLVDYENQVEQMRNRANPVAMLVSAHLIAMRTQGKSIARCDSKIALALALSREGFDLKELHELFRLVDWMLDLPEELELQFRAELQKLKDENIMPYVTSIERLAIKEGREQGIEEGIEKGIEKGIEQGIEKGVIAGKIQLLQQMLGEPETPTATLVSLSDDQLQSMMAGLKEAIEKRK